MRLLALMTGVALACVACGGSGSKGPTGPITLDALAARAHCTITDRSGDALTPTSGQCAIQGGATIDIATFVDHPHRDAWALFVRSTGYQVETGDLWAISGTDAGLVRAAAATIRG